MKTVLIDWFYFFILFQFYFQIILVYDTIMEIENFQKFLLIRGVLMEYTDSKIFFTLLKFLFILTTIVLLSVFNKTILCKYTKKNIETKYKLSTILQQFCEVEGLVSPLIVPSKLFW